MDKDEKGVTVSSPGAKARVTVGRPVITGELIVISSTRVHGHGLGKDDDPHSERKRAHFATSRPQPGDRVKIETTEYMIFQAAPPEEKLVSRAKRVAASLAERGKAVLKATSAADVPKAGPGDDEVMIPMEARYVVEPKRPPPEKRKKMLLAAARRGAEAGDAASQLRVAALDLLGLDTAATRSEEQLIEAIADGFSADVLGRLRAAGWSYAVMDQVIAPRRTLMRRKAAKQRLTPPESDAAWRLALALVSAEEVFASRAAALDWLVRSKTALQNRSPAELLQSSVGTAYILSMLRRIDQGDYL